MSSRIISRLSEERFSQAKGGSAPPYEPLLLYIGLFCCFPSERGLILVSSRTINAHPRHRAWWG